MTMPEVPPLPQPPAEAPHHVASLREQYAGADDLGQYANEAYKPKEKKE